MKEVNFNSILVKSLNNAGMAAQKIPDMPGFSKDSRFIPPKPFDLFAVSNKAVFLFEGKFIKPKLKNRSYSSFAIDKIKEHQIKNLVDYNDFSIAASYLALYVWVKNKVSEVNFIPISNIVSMINGGHTKMSAQFIENWPLKYSTHKGMFALPIDIESILLGNKIL